MKIIIVDISIPENIIDNTFDQKNNHSIKV